jgi:hypothetical protein
MARSSAELTQARECPQCGNIHDCQFFAEMQVLTAKLDKKINELVDSIDWSERPELEDK